jgi:hypothetical protein
MWIVIGVPVYAPLKNILFPPDVVPMVINGVPGVPDKTDIVIFIASALTIQE